VRWLVDECVDAALVSSLRAACHDVSYISEIASGLTDEDALRLAQEQQRVFLTEDKDFGELVFRFRLPVPGLVLLRIDPSRTALKWPRLHAVISQLGDRLLGRYVVVTETRLRSRSLT
jgi:predicted nuclease of predicted toxin-antitoxin system